MLLTVYYYLWHATICLISSGFSLPTVTVQTRVESSFVAPCTDNDTASGWDGRFLKQLNTESLSKTFNIPVSAKYLSLCIEATQTLEIMEISVYEHCQYFS